jgi:ribosomal protein S18 acetylase RimI-like enzyme
MLRSIPRKLFHLALIARYLGTKSFLIRIKQQFFSEFHYIGLEKDLTTDDLREVSSLDYYLALASDEDMSQILPKARQESRKFAVDLIYRKWFYDKGFKRCYIAKIRKTNDICGMQWLILPNDFGVNSLSFKKRYPELRTDEALLEMAYTFEKYRGNRLDPSMMLKLSAIAKSQGVKRALVYVRSDNIPSIKCCERAGFKQFETRYQRKLLFKLKTSSLGSKPSIGDMSANSNN